MANPHRSPGVLHHPFDLDRDREATLALFEIIKNQPGY